MRPSGFGKPFNLQLAAKFDGESLHAASAIILAHGLGRQVGRRRRRRGGADALAKRGASGRRRLRPGPRVVGEADGERRLRHGGQAAGLRRLGP